MTRLSKMWCTILSEKMLIILIELVLHVYSSTFIDEIDKPESTSMPTFTTTFEGFLSLVDKDYWIKSVKYDRICEKISLSMYRYYMMQHLYARMVLIRSEKGLTDVKEEEFWDYIVSTVQVLPLEIFMYLNTIGDIIDNCDTKKIKLEYSSIIWPNINGDFGRINHDNHWMYMSFPAPRVVAQALSEDYRHARRSLSKTIWNLPDDLTPSIPSGYPTANLLGWKPAVILTLQQRQILEICGIDDKNFDNIYSKFHVNPQLLEAISMILRKYIPPEIVVTVSEHAYYTERALFDRSAQLDWLERHTDDIYTFGRTIRYIDRGMTRMAVESMDYNLIGRTMSMAYRVNKSSTVHDWCIYDFNNYKNVPEEWIRTSNYIFNFGNISISKTVTFPSSVRKYSRIYDDFPEL